LLAALLDAFDVEDYTWSGLGYWGMGVVIRRK